MKQLTIGLDIDGVIVDYVSTMLPVLSRACHRDIKYQDIVTYDLRECLGIDGETLDRVWEQTLQTDLFLAIPPVRGAIEGIESLRLRQHEIWLVTARPSSIQEITLSWLETKKVKYDRIVFDKGSDKHLVTSGFDIFVDDSAEVIRPIAATGTPALLFDQPWNRMAELPRNCRRVYDWKTILQVIDELESS
jgi:uncharacterized HAD superfamily protein